MPTMEQKKHLFSHLSMQKFDKLLKVNRLYDKELNPIDRNSLEVGISVCELQVIPPSQESNFSLDKAQATKIDDLSWVEKRLAEIKKMKQPMKTTQDYIAEVKANFDLLNDSEFVLKFFTQAETEKVLVLSREQKDMIFKVCLDACHNNNAEAKKLARYRSVLRLIE